MKNIILLSALILASPFIYAKETGMKNALIVYGSFMGSTKEVAERIKATLETRKYTVDIAPAASATGAINGYDLVVLGSAIHGATPHPDVLAYVEKNKTALQKARTAVFIVCITITSNKADKREAASHYPEKVAIGFTPVSTAVFGGICGDAGWFGNLMGELILGVKTGDYRDWKKIEEWAISL